jgi:arylsulfatase A-like enzyme
MRGRYSHIDLVPTLLELMDHPIPDRLPGRSLVPAMRKGREHREPVFIEWSPGPESSRELPFPGFTAEEVRRANRAHTRTVVTPDGWKLCLSDADRHQLFDLSRDPFELTNLFYAGGHDDVIRRLADEIHRWQRGVNDVVEVEP